MEVIRHGGIGLLCLATRCTNGLVEAKRHSDLVYFQQDTRFVVVVTIAVLSGAVKFRVGFEVTDFKVTKLFALIVQCIVARTVYTALIRRPISINYNAHSKHSESLTMQM